MVNDLFQSIASQFGFQVILGNNNLCNIKRKSNGEETIIELPRNGEILYIYAIVGDVPFSNRENFFEFILKLNLHGNGTGHRGIGIDAQANKFVFSQLLPIKNLDESFLLQSMNEFFLTVSQLKEKLSQFFQLQSVEDHSTGELLSPNLNLVI
jgi:hypothetical protein